MIPALDRGGLHGYKLSQPAATRRKHLREAIDDAGLTEVKRRLNALWVFNIHHQEKADKIEKDKIWLWKHASR